MKAATRIMLGIAAFASLGLASVPAASSAPRATNAAQVQRDKREHRRQMDSLGVLIRGQRKGPGWSPRHVQRMAKKACNRRRNKLAHR